MTLWRQALEIARVDLRVERHVGEILRVIIPFGIISLIVFPLAMGAQASSVARFGPAIFWALAVLFGMQVALRQSASDSQTRRDLYALLGVDPAARFAGRVLSGTFLMVAFMLALLGSMILLYGPSLSGGETFAALVASGLVSIGLTELGTLAGEVTSGLRNRTALASLIIAPLAVPLVVGASQTVEAVTQGTGILPWVMLLAAVDLALAVAGVGLARPLDEATR